MDIHSGGNASPASRAENLGPEIGGRLVSQDMEGIFGTANPFPNDMTSPGSRTPGSRTVVPIVARSSRPPNGFGVTRVLALPGVVFAGALAALIVLAQHGAPDPSPGQIPKLPAPPVSQVPEARRALASAEPPAVSAMPASMANQYGTEAPAAVESLPRRSLAAYQPKHKGTRRLATTRTARADRRHGGESCNSLRRVDLAWCMRPQIVNADRQLRNAYHDAARAGVDRRVLVSYRNQWSRLRRRAISDPRRVAIGYRQMAQQLDAARSSRRARNS